MTDTEQVALQRTAIESLREIDGVADKLNSIVKQHDSANHMDSSMIIDTLVPVVKKLKELTACYDLDFDEDSDADRYELVQFLFECGEPEDALNTMREGDSFYLGWSNGNFIKYGDDSFASANFSGDTKQALEYLEETD